MSSLTFGGATPNENPVAPMLPPDANVLTAEVVNDDFAASPGLTVSQATQAVSDGLFSTMHTPHFHEPSSDVLNTAPQPSVFVSAEVEDNRFSGPESSAPSAMLSSSSSSSLSPSPKSQSTYHDKKADLGITCSPEASSFMPIFRIVRRCSSSQ